MKICKLESTILLKFLIFYMLAKTTQSASIDKGPDAYGPELNGKCVKKFVLPSRKQCQTPNLKFGGFELELGGRIAKFWCEEGWTLATAVPGHIHAMCKLGQWDRPLPTCVRPGANATSTTIFSALTLDEITARGKLVDLLLSLKIDMSLLHNIFVQADLPQAVYSCIQCFH